MISNYLAKLKYFTNLGFYLAKELSLTIHHHLGEWNRSCLRSRAEIWPGINYGVPRDLVSLKIFETKKSSQLLRHPPPLEDLQLSPIPLEPWHPPVGSNTLLGWWPRRGVWTRGVTTKKNGWIRSKPLPRSGAYMGVEPKIGGKPPKRMVYNGKPYQIDDLGVPLFLETPI